MRVPDCVLLHRVRARPFIGAGWGGQIGLAVLYNAAEISVMYGLHKMERIVPLGPCAIGGYAGYHNLQLF